MDATTQLANDVHFLTAPLRFLWHVVLSLLFLLVAPAIFAIVPIVAVRYASPDEIWLLKWLFGVLGPFASTFWFVIIAILPAHNSGERGLGFHFKSFASMAFGFLVSAAAMFFFATNYDVCYIWNDRAWFTGAWLALLSPFAFLLVWRLLKQCMAGGGRQAGLGSEPKGEEVDHSVHDMLGFLLGGQCDKDVPARQRSRCRWEFFLGISLPFPTEIPGWKGSDWT